MQAKESLVSFERSCVYLDGIEGRNLTKTGPWRDQGCRIRRYR